MRLCVDWRRLNSLLVVDSGGLDDIQSMFFGLKGKQYFTQIDLISGFHQMPMAEKDNHKTTFRDADCQLWKFYVTVLPSVFTTIVKTYLAPSKETVVSWIDDTLISSFTWEEHLNPLRQMFEKLLRDSLSVNFAKCNFAASSQQFLGMVIESTGYVQSNKKWKLLPISRVQQTSKS